MFKYLELIILAFWGLGIAAWFLRRRTNSRSRLDRRHTQELADRLGLVFDPCGVRGGVSAFGQLPDGRAVRLYEEHKNKSGGLLPWQRGLRVSSVLEVGVESEAFDSLSVEQREDARHALYSHYTDVLGESFEELTRTGYSGVMLQGDALRVRGSLTTGGADRVAALLECLGRMAAEIESRCVHEARTGQKCISRPRQTKPAGVTESAIEWAADESVPGETWACTACQAVNPMELRTCQMCSAARECAPQPAT